MKNHVKCNVCGYITTKGKAKNECPACGAPAQSFEPYVSGLSFKRESFLSLHLHPIIVHLPIALVVLALLFDIAAFISAGTPSDIITAGVKINTVLLPLFVLTAALLGMLDGRMRFRRLTTKKLRFKTVASIVFLAVSVTAALVALLVPLSPGALIVLIVLMCAGLVTAGLLGKAGAQLICAATPG